LKRSWDTTRKTCKAHIDIRFSVQKGDSILQLQKSSICGFF